MKFISESNVDVITKFFVIRYYINIKDKLEKQNELELREEKIIIISFKQTIDLLKPVNANEYFIDITFIITPKIHRLYKIMTISCLENNNPKFVCFIALIYLDTISYKKIFSYLKENYEFYPKVIHIDFEVLLRKAILDSEIFENKPILCSCFYHFSANIRKRWKN